MENYLSDNQLIFNYLKGDEKSLEILIKRYLKPIYNFAYRYLGHKEEAEEITQEVFIKVLKNLKKFDQNKKFKTWLFSIAKNTSLDWLKKKKAISFSSLEDEKKDNLFIENLVDPHPLPNEIFEKDEIKKTLEKAINQLSLKYRLVLFLHYKEHFTFQEIAEIFKKPLNTIKSWHYRALIQLRKLLS